MPERIAGHKTPAKCTDKDEWQVDRIGRPIATPTSVMLKRAIAVGHPHGGLLDPATALPPRPCEKAVPKIMHFLWFCSPVPERIVQRMMKFALMNPTWKVMILVDNPPQQTEIDLMNSPEVSSRPGGAIIVHYLASYADDFRNMDILRWIRNLSLDPKHLHVCAGMSDVARLEVMFKHGVHHVDLPGSCAAQWQDSYCASRLGRRGGNVEMAGPGGAGSRKGAAGALIWRCSGCICSDQDYQIARRRRTDIACKHSSSSSLFRAFASRLGDGSVVTWGHAEYGGDSSAVQHQLKNVHQIQASGRAFAAILCEGSVVTWGDAAVGGDSSTAQDQLKDVQQIQASDFAFAAILSDRSVVSWGCDESGGDSGAVQDQLKTAQSLTASDMAFAAILGDGSVVTWGDARYGGDSRAVQDLQQIQTTRQAFAALFAL
eukprot:s1134_g7.t1